jgi:outer membrane protein assembly factor BamD (BamD/ComL family)
MSISALSSNLISDLAPQQWQNPFEAIKQDFQQLASALQSGNLSGAQSAYANIQQLLQGSQGSSASNTSSTSTGSNTLQNDFLALGQALQSGDLSTAQNAFAQLQSDFQASRQSGGAGAAPGTQAQGDQYVASQEQNPAEQALQDYTQLASDLQSGNLTGAQSDYANLQQLVQAYQGPAKSDSAIQSDFATLGQDLQSGNLTQAQSEFSQLQSDITSAAQPQTQYPVRQVRQDYGQLASALQSGNLTDAQSAFAALEQALQTQSGTASTASSSTSTSNTSTSNNDPIANDLNALGQALSSGSLTQAQTAFSQLQSDIQTAEQAANPQTQGSGQWQRADWHDHQDQWGGSASQSSPSTASSSNAYNSRNSSSAINVYA